MIDLLARLNDYQLGWLFGAITVLIPLSVAFLWSAYRGIITVVNPFAAQPKAPHPDLAVAVSDDGMMIEFRDGTKTDSPPMFGFYRAEGMAEIVVVSDKPVAGFLDRWQAGVLAQVLGEWGKE